MKILFITSRLPYPPNRGDRLRVFNFIKSLYRQHEIHLISFISSEDELQNAVPLKRFCKELSYIKKNPIQSAMSVLLNIWRSEPLQSHYYRSSKMGNLVDRKIEINKYDLIYIHLFRMAQFLVDHVNQYRVLDLTDVISNEIKRSLPYRNFFWKILYTVEYRRIFRYERRLIGLFEEIWLVSPADEKILATHTPSANIINVTNGIDSTIFRPIDIDPIPYSVIFTGHMGIPHNIDAARYFALQIFPHILKKFPESVFIIAGAEPSRSVLELSSNPNIKILGYVEDLNYELNRSQIFVAPLRFSAGIQNKVLEAMAAGRPVVTTRIVNEGINAQENEEIIIAETPDEFITQISRLFLNEALRKKFSSSGPNFVRNKHSWDSVLQRINFLEQKISEKNSNYYPNKYVYGVFHE